MARGIILRVAGAEVPFGITRVEREKLYGRRERVAVDEAGRPCQPAWLTPDGEAVIPPGGLAYNYVDAAFDTVERSELVSVDAAGQPAALHASTLDVPVDAVEVSPSRLLDCIVTAVYQLVPAADADAVSTLAGKVLEARFLWRDGPEPASPMFVVTNEQGVFGLVAEPHGFETVRRETVVVEEAPEAPDADDELDFSMM